MARPVSEFQYQFQPLRTNKFGVVVLEHFTEKYGSQRQGFAEILNIAGKKAGLDPEGSYRVKKKPLIPGTGTTDPEKAAEIIAARAKALAKKPKKEKAAKPAKKKAAAPPKKKAAPPPKPAAKKAAAPPKAATKKAAPPPSEKPAVVGAKNSPAKKTAPPPAKAKTKAAPPAPAKPKKPAAAPPPVAAKKKTEKPAPPAKPAKAPPPPPPAPKKAAPPPAAPKGPKKAPPPPPAAPASEPPEEDKTAAALPAAPPTATEALALERGERFSFRRQKGSHDMSNSDWRQHDGPTNFTKAEPDCLRCLHLTALVGQSVTCVSCLTAIERREGAEALLARASYK